MRIIFAIFVCSFGVTIKAFESNSTSMESKIIMGYSVERSRIKRFICPVKYKDISRGLGLFISSKNFLTAASILLTKKLGWSGFSLKKVNPKYVTIQIDLSSETYILVNYIKVKKIITMNVYKHKSSLLDIAVLQIEDDKDVPQGPYPELANSEAVFGNNVLYGFLHCKYQFPSIAAKVYVKINNQTVCQNMFNQKLVISDNSLICGSATDGFIEKLDLGGPLFINDKLAGVYVFGAEKKHKQGLFANVLKNREFINNLKNRANCQR